MVGRPKAVVPPVHLCRQPNEWPIQECARRTDGRNPPGEDADQDGFTWRRTIVVFPELTALPEGSRQGGTPVGTLENRGRRGGIRFRRATLKIG